MANLSATMLRNNYVFFGTPSFAAIILEKLIGNDWVPKALVCNPDRPVGRRQIITPPPAKTLALKHGVPVFQPANKEALVGVSDELFTEADFGVLAAYGQIVPAEVIKKARLGIIGVHPSLLPKFRGSTPIQSAILEGVSETGVSLFLMDEKVDHGPILAQRKLLLDNLFSNSRELEKRLAELGAELLVETLPKFVKGEITPLPQDEVEASYTKKFTIEDAYISPEELKAATSGENKEKVFEIERKIRAFNPEPGVWTLRQAQGRPKRIKLLEALIKENKLVLKTIQPEGKKPVNLVTE